LEFEEIYTLNILGILKDLDPKSWYKIKAHGERERERIEIQIKEEKKGT
jgi:hypothetical protein